MRTHRWILLAVLIAGCSSHDSTTANVPALCREVESTVCLKNQACSLAVGETTAAQGDTYVANCKGSFSTTLDCSRQTKLTGNVDACQTDTINMPCDLYVIPTGLPIPASCRHIFQ